MDKTFWNKKNVFLTGHTGFKGSWLSVCLNMAGAKVTGYSIDVPTNPSLFEFANLKNVINSKMGDINNFEKIKKEMHEAQPEIVFHMAAQPLVRYSYAHPIETYQTNVMGTVHLLEAVKSTPSVKAVIIITTDKCYENKEWEYGYRENEPMGGYDPYSSSKGCAELVTSAYRNSYFNPADFNKHKVVIASVRAGNVIGGGDWALDRLIPDIIMSFSRGKSVSIRNPNAIRPWQHVLEPLSGYISLAEHAYKYGADFATAFNFGPADKDCQPVDYIVAKMSSYWGDDARFVIEKNDHLHEAHFLKLDSSKAYAKLKWRPKLSLDEALKNTVDWYKEVLKEPANALAMTEKQILSYFELGHK